MNNARLYAPIEKTEVQDDGTIKVWGYASAPTEDSDGEIITADAMKAALPDYLKFGAVREMHGKSAAGTAIEAEVQEDGRTWFGAHVVDPVAVKKCQTNVYKGFSIGGRITSRDDIVKTTITGLKLIEVSLVDRPANPDAVFTMFKAEAELTAVEELAKMVNDGILTPEQLVALAKAAVEAENPPAEAVAVVALDDDAAKVEDAPVNAPDAPEAAIELAAAPDDLEKAGARNSATDKHTIQSMHDGACALGANCASDKAASDGDLAKVAGDEAIAKVEALTAERDEAIAKAATLATELDALKAAPANGRAILKAFGKGTDVIATESVEVAKVIGFDGKPDPIASMIKAIHAAKIGG